MKINVIVGDHDEEYESPIEEASFYDVTESRYPESPKEIPASIFAAAPELLSALKRLVACPNVNLDMLSPETIKAAEVAREVIIQAQKDVGRREP